MSEWISVKDRLPKTMELVFVYRKGLDIVRAEYLMNDGEWFNDGIYKAPVTHWMTLPEPPKED